MVNKGDIIFKQWRSTRKAKQEKRSEKPVNHDFILKHSNNDIAAEA